MRKKPENLADPRVLLTEAGEQQWLNDMLDETTAQQQAKKSLAGAAKLLLDATTQQQTEKNPVPAAKRPAPLKRARKAA